MSERSRILQPLCLAGMLAVGAGIVWALAAVWSIATVDQATREHRRFEQVAVRIDGTPVIRTYPGGPAGETTHRTLKGEPLEVRSQNELRSAYLASVPRRPRLFFRAGWSERLRMFTDNRRPVTYWYLVHNGEIEGEGYFVGYNSKTKRRVGYMGLAGFRPDKPPPGERFPLDGRMLRYSGPVAHNAGRFVLAGEMIHQASYDVAGGVPRWRVYLASGRGLLEIDLGGRSVRTLLESARLISVGVLDQAVELDRQEDSKLAFPIKQYVAARGRDEVFLLDATGKLFGTYPIPETLRGEPFWFYLLSDDRAMLHCGLSYVDGRYMHELFWINQQGEVVDREEVTLQRGSSTQAPAVAPWLLCLEVPAPAIVMSVTTLAALWEYLERGGEADYSAALALARALSNAWPALLALHALAAGLAWLCYRRQRRYAMGWTRVWVAFVFLFGVPGLLGYLFHRRWPVRVRCEECGVAVPRDRESCSGCGSDFAEPSARGIEVFA